MREHAVNSVFNHPNGDVYLSFSEVARRCKVRNQTVRTWIKKHALPTFLVMGRQMVREADLSRFMQPEPLSPGTLLKNSVVPKKTIAAVQKPVAPEETPC